MFRKLSIVGLAGAPVFVGSGLAMAFAGTNITQPETLVFTETSLKGRFIEAGKPGFGPGDSKIFVDSLNDPAGGSRVGTVRGQCTIQIGHWQTCQVGGFIDGRGELFVSGVTSTSDQATAIDLAITGGTGEFEDVRGTVHVEFISNTEQTTTLNLIP